MPAATRKATDHQIAYLGSRHHPREIQRLVFVATGPAVTTAPGERPQALAAAAGVGEPS
jgi:hypothetical protein